MEHLEHLEHLFLGNTQNREKKVKIFTHIENILNDSEAWSTQNKSNEDITKPSKQTSSTSIEKRSIYKIFEKEKRIAYSR